jgi:excisionase family DNA binding protein
LTSPKITYLPSQAWKPTSPKELTNERLNLELAEDLAATAGQLRHMPPARSGSSLNPNATFIWNVVDSHFLNRESHEEAVAILEGWKPQPWKGQIWQAQRNIDRVWTGPTHTDLQWTGAEWQPYKRQDAVGKTPAYPAPSKVSVKTTEALQKVGGIAEDELNAAYVEYAADPTEQRDSWVVTLSAFARSTKRVRQVNKKYWHKAEIYMDIEDIFDEFSINLMHRIESGQYTHKGKMQNWIGYIWGNFFFPEIQTKMNEYIDRSIYVNTLDPDLEGYETQEHSIGVWQIEDQQATREQEGYAPISRDRIFRQLSAATQTLVQMLAEGLTQDEIAVNLKISPRQLRRRLDKAEEDGEAVRAALSGVLHCGVQGCADEGNVLPWPTDEYIGDISACAAPSENKLADMVEAFENAITVQQLATILQCSRREIYKLVEQKRIPALRLGTMIRLDPGQIAEWLRSKMTIAA